MSQEYYAPIGYDAFHQRITTMTDRARLMERVEGTVLAARLHTIFEVESEIRHHEHATTNLRFIAQALFLDLDRQEFRRHTSGFWGNPSRSRRSTPISDSPYRRSRTEALRPPINEQTTSPSLNEILNHYGNGEPEDRPPSHIGIRTVSPTGEEDIESVPRVAITQYVDDLLENLANAAVAERNARANGGEPIDTPSYADPTPPLDSRSTTDATASSHSTPGISRAHHRIRCHYCRQLGHIRRDCPRRQCAVCHQTGHTSRRCPRVAITRRPHRPLPPIPQHIRVVVDNESEGDDNRLQYPVTRDQED